MSAQRPHCDPEPDVSALSQHVALGPLADSCCAANWHSFDRLVGADEQADGTVRPIALAIWLDVSGGTSKPLSGTRPAW
jgi:hypothetical protein